ncbi:MAG: acyl-CoA/acyl-ACP dehydrogenase [Planctomycetota bacterium]|nr:acyl-CoA/acyl-ACP dehydrogenase [Planctomycetota bacterium]
MDISTLHDNIKNIAGQFAEQRRDRQARRELDPVDFERLHEAGLTLFGLPRDRGGLWESVATTARPICDVYRSLARGDSSVALVAAMHPAVLSYWLTAPDELATDVSWQAQRAAIVDSVVAGQWWGTITSEPGSGGDITRSRATAIRTNGLDYKLTGQKHFGSGSGVMSVMVTTAVPDGEQDADWFFVDVRDVPWDNSTGLKLIAEWDGQGMTATQSHAMEFTAFPATRMAWTNNLLNVAQRAGGFIGCLFTAVIVGIIDEAMHTASQILKPLNIGAFEKVEWTRAQTEHWLIGQALNGMLDAVETQADPRRDVLLGKTAIAELSESVMTRLCRTLGGSTFSRRSPFGFWFEDVRALGFLRPPWNLAFATLMNTDATLNPPDAG